LDPKKIKIRRRNKEVSQEIKVLGFDKQGIRNLDKQAFHRFLEEKE